MTQAIDIMARKSDDRLPMTIFPEKLSQGYQAFLEGRFPAERERFEELATSGQQPEVMIIGCCDSRVSPEAIFNARPGEMFVVRNVANLVPPYEQNGDYHGTSAALEFAVQALRVKHVVVLGHARCGGVRAFADDGQEPLSPGDFIGKWMQLLAPASERAGPRGRHEAFADYTTRLELASISASLANIRTFPCVKILEDRKKLSLHGAYFDVRTGVLMLLDQLTGRFVPAAAEVPARVGMVRCV